MMKFDTTGMCSHLQRKLFEEDGICHHLWRGQNLTYEIAGRHPLQLAPIADYRNKMMQ